MNSLKQWILQVLSEDIGAGDITTEALIPAGRTGSAQILAKQSLVVAGLDVARLVFEALDSSAKFEMKTRDGAAVSPGTPVCAIRGELRALLMGERTALNILQHLSGIATHVQSYAALLAGKKTKLTDTRKTTPGWRVLEKYAVRMGGGCNHRMGLFDGVLIKDNHIAAAGGIRQAVAKVRASVSHFMKIEVETETLEQVEDALSSGADIIMLDNMDLPTIKKAVALIAGRALVEASGNVTRDTLVPLADAGVDLISCGALTHSAPSVDLSMDIRPE